MTVVERVADLRAQLREAQSTKCGECSHPFHLHHGRCEHPIWPKPGTSPCRCRKFVDPSNVLSLTARRSAP
jgi:hypothetical protein